MINQGSSEAHQEPSPAREPTEHAHARAEQRDEQLQHSKHAEGARRCIKFLERRGKRRGERSAIVAACLALDLLPKQVMFVSDHSPVLQAAKQAGAFSCHLVKRAPGAPDSLPSDFRALDCYGIQDAVEELNGITFRDPDTEIRTQFGVYST